MRFFGTCVLLVLLMAGTAMGRGAGLATSGVKLDTLPPFHRALILHELGLEFELMSKPIKITSLVKQSHWYTHEFRQESRPEQSQERGLRLMENIATIAAKDLAVYFPSLSRLAVSDLLQRKEDFGESVSSPERLEVEDSLATKALRDVALLMGDTGRRDILEKLNSLEPDVVKNVVREVNRKWNLSLVAGGVILNKENSGGKIANNELEKDFYRWIDRYRGRISNTRKGYMPIEGLDYPQAIAKLDKDMERLQEVAGMPHGTARNEAMAGLVADLNTDKHFGAFSYNEVVEEQQQGSMLMKILLEDITPFTMAAVHQLRSLRQYTLGSNSEAIRNLLDAELQLALTNRSYPYQGATSIERY